MSDYRRDVRMGVALSGRSARYMVVTVLVSALCVAGWSPAVAEPASAESSSNAPPRLVATAFRILKWTTNRESAYASIVVAQNNKVYVGPARYGENSHLVELDPVTAEQRAVVDTHELCGLSVTGFAAQAKIHTRLFVAPSGTLYFGSKQGYPRKGQSIHDYLGGYVMSYDPATDVARSFGKVPFRGHGVYDVVADESRGLLHITTSNDGQKDYFWYTYDIDADHYEGVGPRLHVNAHPLLAPDGRVYAMTHDGGLACYSPDDNGLTVRPLMTGPETPFVPTNTIYQMEIAPDGSALYMIPWQEPLVYRIALEEGDAPLMLNEVGRFSDSDKSGSMDPSWGPDGKLYIVAGWAEAGTPRVSFLHVVSYDPASDETVDHGVITIGNPDALVADAGGEDAIGKSPYHGLRRLKDGTMYPRYTQGIAVGDDGAIYVMTLYPLCVLRVEGVCVPRAVE